MILHGRLLNGQGVCLTIKDGIIQEINPIKTKSDLAYIAPGLIDLQINGFASVDYNCSSLTKDDIQKSFLALARLGYTKLFPTIITNDIHKIAEILYLFDQARKEEEIIDLMIGGFHIEGPFISPLDGPRGAHDKRYVQKPDIKALKLWQNACNHAVKIVTLSPEWESEAFIQFATANNICISIGHSAANEKQIAKAIKAGACASTHIGNGCAVEINRHHNVLFPQLNSDDLWSFFIGDGFHLPLVFMEMVYKLKKEKAILTSDATKFAGMKPGIYHTHIGGDVVLSPKGRLSLKDNPELLAGSAVSLLGAINYLYQKKFLSLAEIWSLASHNPARFLGWKQQGVIDAGYVADLSLFHIKENNIHIVETWISGKKF